MSKTNSTSKIRPQRPINRFGVLDSVPLQVPVIGLISAKDLAQYLKISEKLASIVHETLRGPVKPAYALALVPEINTTMRDQVLRSLLAAEDSRLAINDVVPVNGRIMSDRPFALRIHFSASTLHLPRLVSVRTEWLGEPFVVERLIGADDLQRRYVQLQFGEEQTLPVGAATFRVRLFNEAGHQAQFQVTCAVLPSNPFSLSLGPDGDFVTGSWSARGVRHGSAYDTGVAVTLNNGDGAVVAVQSGFVWKFWDGGVGGTLIEQGTGDFGGPISVPAFGTWGGWIDFNSPSGSGIFNTYNDRNDMTIEIIMTKVAGDTVSGTITARTMFKFGVNITAVADEDFSGQQWADLDLAAGVTRTIYERRDMTFDHDDRFIALADVGGYEIITSDDEFHDLVSDWSGPDSNNNIDAFIVQAIHQDDVSVDGIDGSVPGPTSHSGGNSGIIVAKHGYVDASGHPRLNSNYLGMLIGHELGHYLGLEHVDEAGNLMLWNSEATDTNLNYGQYRIMITHGWVNID